jgi:hypothetical protein
MQGLSDEDMSREWTWRDHNEGLRFALLGTYQELRDLAVTLAIGRREAADPITQVQRVLAQYHAAYCDLLAVLSGVGDDALDLPPAEGEWPLREILGHIIGAERVFFALVHQALEQQRAGQEPAELSGKFVKALVGPRETFVELMKTETLEGILAHYAGLHHRILLELSGLSDHELTAPSKFWEPDPLSIRYRLHRFDAHLRQHTVQAEKTLLAIGRKPNEAQMLIRLVYNGLAEAEGTVIGAWEYGTERQNRLAAVIENRAEEIINSFGD